MPKRRPIFEFKGLEGLLGSSSSDSSSYRRRSGSTDESPRRPSYDMSSRYRSPRRHHRRSGKHKNRRRSRKSRKHRYSHRSYYANDQRYRRQDGSGIRDRSGRRRDASQPRVTRFADDMDGIGGRGIRSQSSDGSRTRTRHSPGDVQAPRLGSHYNPAHHEGRHLGSPPPYDPRTHRQYPLQSPEHPGETYGSPAHEREANERSGVLQGYPDEYDREVRAIDPRLEQNYSPSGLPAERDVGDERGSERSSPRHRSEIARRHLSHERHKHRRQRHTSGSRHRRRKQHRRVENRQMNRDGNGDESREDGNRGEDNDSEQAQHDENGNPIKSSTQGRRGLFGLFKRKKDSQEEGKPPKKKKRNIAKIAALAVGAVAVGLVAKRIISKRKKKKAEHEAQVAAEQQEAAGPYGGSGGELFSGSNPLQLEVPKSSISVKVPETEAFIVERGGKYNRRLSPGSNMLIPFVDRVAFRFSLKEASLAVPVQQCYTRENASVMASALLFAKVEDAVATAYGVDDARRSLMLLAQTAMRKEIAKLSVEQMLQDREGLGNRILGNMNRASRPWGIRCTRFEIRDLDIPEEVRLALGQQAERERQVRANVFASEGEREVMKNRADAEMHAQMRMSQARQIDAVNQAIGEAHAISERGEAVAGAMRDVAEVITEPGGEKAMQMRIAEQYIHSYANAAKNQEHLPPPPTEADMTAAIGSAMGLLSTLGEPGSTVTNPHTRPGAGSTAPPPALEQPQEYSSQSSDDTEDSNIPAPSQGVSSQQLSQSHHGAQQLQGGMLPNTNGSHHLPQNASGFPQHVQNSHGSYVPHGTPQIHPPMEDHLPAPTGQYTGPIYPQASSVPQQ